MKTNNATWAQPVVAGILDVSAGRFGAIVAAIAGLIGVVLGVRALVRCPARTAFRGRHGASNRLGEAFAAVALRGFSASSSVGS